jgi:hypothetical protein
MSRSAAMTIRFILVALAIIEMVTFRAVVPLEGYSGIIVEIEFLETLFNHPGLISWWVFGVLGGLFVMVSAFEDRNENQAKSPPPRRTHSRYTKIR